MLFRSRWAPLNVAFDDELSWTLPAVNHRQRRNGRDETHIKVVIDDEFFLDAACSKPRTVRRTDAIERHSLV